MLPVDIIDYIIVHEANASGRIESFKEVLATGRGKPTLNTTLIENG